MPKIKASIEISAPQERVWEIISDLDHEPEYWWGTREVHTISQEQNVIKREIYQNFGNHPILQEVFLRPPYEVEVRYLKGATEGVKFLRLEPTNSGHQKLTAIWDIHFPGLYRLMMPIISGHVRKGTTGALQRIKDVSEGRQIQARVGEQGRL